MISACPQYLHFRIIILLRVTLIILCKPVPLTLTRFRAPCPRPECGNLATGHRPIERATRLHERGDIRRGGSERLIPYSIHRLHIIQHLQTPTERPLRDTNTLIIGFHSIPTQ